MKKIFFLILVFLAALLILTGPAGAKIIEEKNGYIVRSGYDSENSIDQILSMKTVAKTLYSIQNGKINYHSSYVSSGKTSAKYDIDWTDSDNNLGLQIITPDTSFGYYHDSIDGVTDGRIYIEISSSYGLTTGTWTGCVKGFSVSGTEYYSRSTTIT
ncbi:MAG: hypothetical protein PHV39_09075 [Methanomicrobium sp.]|nr:hypothetical protein [Methanomicrobium sp.]